MTASVPSNQSWYRSTGLQRAMILASLNPDSLGAYHQQFVVRLGAEIDGALLLRAAQIFLQRHGGLMARFEMRQGELFTRRLETEATIGSAIDLQSEPGSPDERLENFLERDRERGFEIFGDGPAWRSVLLSLGEGERAWVWSHHHALCDNFVLPLSLGVFQLYDRLREGAAVETAPASPDSYDYLRWREEQDWSAQQTAWRERFTAGDRMTALPGVRGDLAHENPARILVPISPETERALRDLCDQSGLTLNTIVVAAWGLWLARTQEEPRAIFGIMRAARKSTIPRAESILGFFTNTIPVAVPMADAMSVIDWLRGVRRELIALQTLEQCALSDIVKWTGLDPGPDGPPSVINFIRHAMADELRTAGLPPERSRISLRQTVDVPLMVNAYESPQLWIEILSRTNGATTEAAARGLSAILRAISIAPEQLLGQIELLAEYDRSVLEVAERGPRPNFPSTCAHELIEREIREQPDGIAAVQGRRSISFREVGQQAEHVARAIRQICLTSDVVAVILPPGPEILCAMLGILRAGAAFFLLNPMSLRLERERMLRRLSVTVAITNESHAIETRAAVSEVFEIEEIAHTGLTSGGKFPRVEIQGTDLAYLVHTSGSTGEKKFVEIEHRALANTIQAMLAIYEMRRGDRRIARATPGTDFFLIETLGCLSGGGTLIFPEHAGAMSLAEFSAMLRRERITITGLPASYWHEWVRTMKDETDVPPDLRLVISSMEKADPALLVKWLELTRDRIRWLNPYGPAEAAIVSTIFRAGDEAAPGASHVPIGRPIANMEVYVLDRARRKMPVGMIGEITISGIGLARGYRGDEETTRVTFVPNPHARSNEFSRLYLTGDYGYVDACGQIVFVGRRDQQVKIAGHRIELGEVEAALQESAAIARAVVTAEGENGALRLVAHILPNESFSLAEMRLWIEQKLAPHLRPADLVVLDRIPQLGAGKVDRRALSLAYQARAKLPNETRSVVDNVTEAKLFALWDELFQRRYVIARHDSFFHLGGNSLLAVRLLARIEMEFGAKLSLHDLFTHPTIAALSALLDRADAENEFVSLIKMNEGGPGRPLFIVHGWSGGVFHCLEFARRLEGERSVFGLQAVELAARPRHQTVEEMASHYADELIRAHSGITFELFGHSLGGMIAYATACELARRGEKVEPLYVVDTLPTNLPRVVHVRRVRTELRPRVLPHLQTILRTSPRYWPRYLRARRRSLESRLRKWPSRENPERKPLAADSDYYYAVVREYVPPCSALEVQLFTPSDRFPTEIYWRHLTSGRVQNHSLTSGHIDMFEGANLENFLQVFRPASSPAQRPRSGTVQPGDNFPANGQAA